MKPPPRDPFLSVSRPRPRPSVSVPLYLSLSLGSLSHSTTTIINYAKHYHKYRAKLQQHTQKPSSQFTSDVIELTSEDAELSLKPTSRNLPVSASCSLFNFDDWNTTSLCTLIANYAFWMFLVVYAMGCREAKQRDETSRGKRLFTLGNLIDT